MYKPSFIVVTSVLVVLALLAFARQMLVGLLPPATTNRLEGSPQHFLAMAAHYPINWQDATTPTFQAARQVGKPVLLVVGIFGGRLTQDLDTALFGDPDTAQFVSQNFVCIRVDGYEHPEWLCSMLPVSRLRTGIFPGYQVWVLDPDGHVITYVVKSTTPAQVDNRTLFGEIVQACKSFADLKHAGVGIQKARDLQQNDLDLIRRQTGQSVPSFTAFTAKLSEQCDLTYGGFPKGDIQALFPNAWRFLTLTGDSKLWKASLDPILFSPVLDIQEGGFFRLANVLNLRRIEFDKASRPNGEMMLTLAMQGQIDGDRFYQTIAEGTFDWLIAESSSTGLIPACQEDDENRQGRSPRLSFPAWKLRETLSSDDQVWASEELDLDPSRNPQMIPFLKSRNTLLDLTHRYSTILGKLRSTTTLKPRLSDVGYMDVNGHTVARLIQTARILGDTERMNHVMPLVKRLEGFKTAKGLVHSIADRSQRRGYLGDYLAYADAKMQEYLVSGSQDAFQQGLTVLNSAVELFRGRRVGEFNLAASPNEMGGFASLCSPDLGDDLGESTSAQMIRLLLSYGRLLQNTVAGKKYLELAQKSVSLLSDLASVGGSTTGGFFCAAADALDGMYAIAVGPRATDFANILCRRVPSRFIAPALGGLRTDIQRLGPGIYIVGSTVDGPYSVEQAAQRLPMTLISRRVR